MSVFNLLHCMLIKNLLTLCSGTGDCEGCKGEALLCGFRFWKWNGNCCFLLLPWKELWTSWWTSHHHWKWKIPMPRNSLPAILYRWDTTSLFRALAQYKKHALLESIGSFHSCRILNVCPQLSLEMCRFYWFILFFRSLFRKISVHLEYENFKAVSYFYERSRSFKLMFGELLKDHCFLSWLI